MNAYKWLNMDYIYKESLFRFYIKGKSGTIVVRNNDLLIGQFTNIKLKPKNP